MRLNRVQLIGNLGKDAELRYTANGQPRLEFSLAVNDSYKKGDDWVDQTEWFNIVAWGDMAEACAGIEKGTPAFVEGKFKTRSWDGNDGQKHYKSEVIASIIRPLVKPPSREQKAQAIPDDDDLPFE